MAIGFGLLGFLIGGFTFGALKPTAGVIPPLRVLGDVTNSLKLDDPQQLSNQQEISYGGQSYHTVKLKDIIDEAKPVGRASRVLLVGSDGFITSFKAEGLEKCYITFTARNGWEAINLNHPVNSNAKMLKEIIVVSEGGSPDHGLWVIDQNSELVHVTPGQLYTQAFTAYPFAEGKASVEKEGKTYESEVYTQRRVFRLSDLTPVNDKETIMVVGEKGEYRWCDNQGYFELKDNYINYLQIDERSQVERVKGVMIDPPAVSIMDTYYDVQHFLENGEKVLVIVLDGFSYRQYLYAIENGYVPLLQEMGMAEPATAVYPAENNVCWAAMITGKAPEDNGIVTVQDQDLQVSSIFTVARQLQKEALLLQGDQNMLKTGTTPVVCSDKNGDGTADDELYAATLARLGKAPDLLMVRFNGIEASSRRCGELSRQTMASIKNSDKLLGDVLSRWQGHVIITSTGINVVQQTGSSRPTGKFNCDSMLVPYWRLR